jgi:hypothetical protein
MDPDKSGNTVHEPELPGVRTYQKDVGDEKSGFSFGGIKLTVPDKAVEGNIDATRGGQVSGGKQLFDVERAFNDELVQEGTIVTDRKRKRTSTGSLLKSAMTEWWGKTQKSMETTVDKFEFLKQKEEQKMEAPEARTNVIQEAAKLARQAPRDDHALVVEKVRTFAHDAEVVTGQPFTIKEPEVKVGAHWTKPEEKKEAAPVMSVGPIPTIDLRTSTIAPAIEKRPSTPLTAYAPKTTAPQPKVSTPTPVQTEKPKIQSMRTPEKMLGGVAQKSKKEGVWSHYSDSKNAPVDLREKIGTSVRPGMTVPHVEAPSVPRPRRTASEIIPAPTPTEVVEQQSLAVSPVAFEHERPATDTPYKPIIETRELSREQREPFTLLAILAHIPRSLIIATIVVVGGGLGVLTAVLVLQNNERTPEDIAITDGPIIAPSFLTADEQVAFRLGNDRSETYRSLIELGTKSTVAVTHTYPTIIDGSREIPAASARVMERLLWNAPGAFTRGLDPHMMFGFVNDGMRAPFVIVQSTNFDVAFAGMLSWERNMSEDLAPLFGEPLVNVGFTDALTSNRSIRILKDANGSERIVYGFVNKNLIIITTSTEALAKLVALVK